MKGKIFIVLAVFISLGMSCLYAQEESAMSLFEIDKLIKLTEYDEALKQLNIYIKNNPENFDNAQIRIKKIMKARREYSILAEKLIELIKNDPGNNREIYEITSRLEEFERHPSDKNLQFIADLKKSAEFNYFRSVFLDIQNQSAKITREGQYVAAIEKVKEGFWLYKDDFNERWADNPKVISDVKNLMNDLNELLNTFGEKNYLFKISDAIADFIKAVNQDQYDLALQRFSTVQSYMKDFSRLRQSIVDCGKKMESKFKELQNLDSDTSDASFLPFMYHFVYGQSSIQNSGILGAVDGQWNAFTGQMNDTVFAALTKKYERYQLVLNASLSSGINRYADLEEKVLNLYQLAENETEHKLVNPYDSYYVITDYVKKLGTESVRINSVWNQLFVIEENQNSLIQLLASSAKDEEKSKGASDLFNSCSELAKIAGVKSDQELENLSWSQNYRQSGMEDWNGLSQKYGQILDDVFEKSSTLMTSAWTGITDYYKNKSYSLYQELLSYNESSSVYNRGFFTKIPDTVLAQINKDIRTAKDHQNDFNANPEMDFGMNYTYPDIALKLARYVQNQIDVDIKNIDSYEKIINDNFNRQQIWTKEAEITSLVENASLYLEEQKENLNSLRGLAENSAALAQAKINASQLAKNEADLRYQEAQRALNGKNFETARKKLQDALTKYDESLANKNDEDLRSSVDSKLQKLGEEIARAENEVVVKEVRELKTKAKDAYFNGRFEDAEKYLNQAKTRWAVTNVTEDEEITNLLNFVNTAISMKTGRDILPSAPQYPEMSQLLNLARQYFDEGSKKIKEGKIAEGNEDLNKALTNIQKLQFVYPLNQEAAILTLKISRLQNPQKFKEEFSQKIETAQIMCKNRETRQEGYANLLDYAQLEPDYPGLKDIIYQVEIDIGIRQKPVDNSGAARAKRLIAEARQIYNGAGNNLEKLQSALEKLDQALALDSNNQTAINLKDKITTQVGGTTSTVLSTEDERLYQLAIQRLQNNNVVGANAIVEQLLKKSSNAGSQKIKDLKNKIDARS